MCNDISMQCISEDGAALAGLYNVCRVIQSKYHDFIVERNCHRNRAIKIKVGHCQPLHKAT